MRKLLCLFFVGVLFSMPWAYAEEDTAMVYVSELIEESVEYSNANLKFRTSMSGGSDDEFTIELDWRDGNESVKILCQYAETCYSIYPVDSFEKTETLLFVLGHYEDIQSVLPEGVELTIQIREADNTKLIITANDYKGYLERYGEALGIKDN